MEFDKDSTVLVRFDTGIEECEKADLLLVRTPLEVLRGAETHPALDTVARVQAEAIRSVNEAWGIFSRSSIALLPHQLWVCKRVNETWPTRWLIADDVGLGKTIEAGLILWPLISSGRVRRVLVLCPAALVGQWQQRLFRMFDLRMQIHSAADDTASSHFWERNDQVVASFQTLRIDRGGRLERLLRSEPWDMLMVDEAHHFNKEESGATHAYRLLRRLVEQDRARSLVLFTGTPHRGKNEAFLSLLELLRPDLFNTTRSLEEQLPHLPRVLIRNNKQNVTDLKGKRLFHPPAVEPADYTYCPEEEDFYQLLTRFIIAGEAYASGLGSGRDQRAVMLVLTAMQKLASSSVAAIRRALRRRLESRSRIGEEIRSLRTTLADWEEADSQNDLDGRAGLEEKLIHLSAMLPLLENEEPRLRELLQAADCVNRESKILRIMEILEDRFAGRQVLFFTEYKATQSLVLSALHTRYGDGCAAFINGDDLAEEVLDVRGRSRTLRQTREEAAELFNLGRVRFLVSTEAGGEGIDLQEQCHSLVHVDLPWNPMRLHQRVGRLNRYGQTRQVEVVLVRNPSNADSRVWKILDEKLDRINRVFGKAMEDPEDLKQLVLGIAGTGWVETLLAEANRRPMDDATLERWFDARTASFGGQGVRDAVEALVGHSSKFDFQRVAAGMPQMDLPDLSPFLSNMLEFNHRRVHYSSEGLSFKTPEPWKGPGIHDSYESQHFRRGTTSGRLDPGLLGVGHRLVDHALEQARAIPACVASVPGLEAPLVVFRVFDRVTVDERVVRSAAAAVELAPSGLALLRDWELLAKLNSLGPLPRTASTARDVDLEGAETFLCQGMAELDLPFRRPEAEVLAILYPDAVPAHPEPTGGDESAKDPTPPIGKGIPRTQGKGNAPADRPEHWLLDVAAALRLDQPLPTVRHWLAERLRPHRAAVARLPHFRRVPRLPADHAKFRVSPPGDVDAILAPEDGRWTVLLREGLNRRDEVRLFLHAFAHRLLGHVRDGDVHSHWDRLDTLSNRRWDREADEILRVTSEGAGAFL